MPNGDAEEATAPTQRSRRAAKLDTAASRRFIENALGIPSNSRSGDRIIMPKSTVAAGKSRRAKSKEARGEQKQDEGDHPAQSEGEQDMDIDEKEESGDGNNSTLAEVDASIDHLNSVLRRYIPKPKSRSDGDQVDQDVADDETDSDNDWGDPMQAFRDIQEARERMMDACDKHEEHVRSQQAKRSQDDEGDSQQEIEEDFRALYMHTMTTAFAAELDDIRTGRASAKNTKRKKGGAKKGIDAAATMMDADNMFVAPDHIKDGADEDPEEKEPLVQENIDVEVLVDILQGGMNSFSANERKMLIEESKWRRRKDEVVAASEEDVMTPHERRRKMLGF